MSPTEAAELNNELQRTAAATRLGIPILNSADFEQGLASLMLHNATALPYQMGLAAVSDPEAADRAALVAGREIKAAGFHWTFGPVADVNNNPANPVIGVRSFGSDTGMVTDLTARQVRAYRRAGIMTTVKHFPGHGDTATDSHTGLPIIPDDWETLSSVHLPPFRAAIDERVDAIMTAHIIVQALDPDLPATLSHRILTGLLREELGYTGLIITDAMSMQAISDRWGTGEAAVLSVQAGADIVMADASTEGQAATVQALLGAAERGALSPERIDASVRRVLEAKEALGLLNQPYVDPAGAARVVRNGEHLAVAQELAHRSITLIKNDGVLPFDRRTPASTLVAGVTNFSQFGGPSVSHVPTFGAEVERLAEGSVTMWSASTDNPSEAEVAEVARLAEEVDRVIVLTYARGVLAQGQARLVAALLDTGKPLVAVATGTPYDVAQYPHVPAFVACYALSFVPTLLAGYEILRETGRVIFGDGVHGKLPVAIPDLYGYRHGLEYDGHMPDDSPAETA